MKSVMNTEQARMDDQQHTHQERLGALRLREPFWMVYLVCLALFMAGAGFVTLLWWALRGRP